MKSFYLGIVLIFLNNCSIIKYNTDCFNNKLQNDKVFQEKIEIAIDSVCENSLDIDCSNFNRVKHCQCVSNQILEVTQMNKDNSSILFYFDSAARCINVTVGLPPVY